MPDQETVLDDKLHWYKDAVIYELHIKAFSDSNGDGIGDFNGLLEKLDYLEFLGVTAIWLLPFYPSPLRDDGYDIADYYSINPSYGNITQFQKLLKEAHKRNLKVITELVINHSSDQHPWFQRARRAPKGSPERNYYVWSDDPNQYNEVRIIFQDYEASNWTWDPVAQQYYWHRFFHHQPDLNFDNPVVQDEVFKMIDYWCKMGVDGFRLDAVPYLFERDGTNCENLPETHVYLKKLRKHVDEHFPGTLLLAEANMWPEDSASYFGDGDECQMNYHFPVMPRMFMALQMEDRYPITDIFDQTPEIPKTCQWAMFLRNHDELTLEMVTDEERDYMYKVYVKDPKARINLGIRHRLAPLMSNNRRKIELLNCLLFSLPGTPVIYYGDEIGMGDNYYLGDRDGVRTPMQWSPDRNAGFSQTNPQKLYLPVISDPEYLYQAVNVETQRRNPSSLLWYMKHIIQMRKRYKAFSRGDMQFINTENSKILAFTRSYEEQTILVVVNLSRFSQAAELELGAFKGYQPMEVFSRNKFPSINAETPYLLTLGAHDCHWFLVQKTGAVAGGKKSVPELMLADWDGLLQQPVLEELEQTVLQDYLMGVRWFGGKGRGIQGISIINQAVLPAGESRAFLLLVEVSYESGLPDIYQLPVGIRKGDSGDRLAESSPQAVIARLNAGGEKGYLYDALYTPELQSAMIQKMANGETLDLGGSEIRFYGNEALSAYLQDNPGGKSRILSAEQSNTSVVYDSAYFLKIYRKVDRSVNPDLEITKYLTEAKFAHIPAFTGAIEWKFGNESIVLGMMQDLIENSGDAWKYMLDQLDSFIEKILSKEPDKLPALTLKGSLTEPVTFEDMPSGLKNLIEVQVAERALLLGRRTGEMHLALGAATDKAEFKSEDYSLHYQRSLYSSMQSLVRTAYQSLSRSMKNLPDDVRAEAEGIVSSKDAVLKQLKRIYAKKLDVTKIRLHGDYHLGQVLFTGKDLMILDFEGEPARSYSERRLKRSPLRDVAGMVRSFHYAAYASLFLNNKVSREDIARLTPYVELWYHYMSGFFMQAYLETVKGTTFIPEDKADLEVLLQTFLMEKAFYELNYELNNRPGWAMIPLRGIKSVMNNK